MKHEINIPMDDIISYRRYLHQHPELSFEEYETAKYIYNTLKEFPNIELEMPIETAVVATLKGKKGEGKTIALRADTDALPVEELADVEFKSQNPGVMHACGHDTHTAMLLGAAKVLSQRVDEFGGTVKFIFQPAEEVPPGKAAELVKLGVMDGVDHVFGMHIFPSLPTGALATCVGPSSASQDIFEITIKGKGSHGSTPELSIDPIMIGAEIVTNLNTIISRNVGAFKNAVLSLGQFTSGEVFNVIPHTATIKGTVRTTDQATRELIGQRIKDIVEHITKAHGAEYDLDYLIGYSAVMNDEATVALANESALKVVEPEMLLELTPMMGSEDFSAYTDVVPGAYIALGGGMPEDGYEYMNHHPMFKIDEAAMENGTRLEVQLVLDILG